MRGECWVAVETYFEGILLPRFSPGCLFLALLVKNPSCGTSLFHKQPVLFNLIRKIWYPDLKEASSMPSVNSSLSFIAKFGILQCLPQCPRTSTVLDSQLVEVADTEGNVGATVSLLMLEDWKTWNRMQTSEVLSSSLHSNVHFQAVNLKTHMLNWYKSHLFSHFNPLSYGSASCLGMHLYILESWKNPVIPFFGEGNERNKGFDQDQINYTYTSILSVSLYSKAACRLPPGNGPWPILVPELSGNSLGGR